MKFVELSSNSASERFALYLSNDEALRLRSELGDLRKSAAGECMTNVYRALHTTFMKDGISNELPAFEAELLEERAGKKRSPRRAYNNVHRRTKAGAKAG